MGGSSSPCHLYQTPPLALLRQLKGLSLGWFFFPCHLYQTPPLCPVMAVKRAIPGVVLLPLSFIPDSPLCPVMAVKRAMPGVVLLLLPFIWGSPQFTLLHQLKGLSALYLSGIAWLPGFHLSSLSRFNPFSYPMVFKKVECHSLCHSAFGQDHACHSFRRGEASFAFYSVVPVELIKMLGDWHSDAVLLYLMFPLAIRLQSVNTIAKSILTTNISTPQPTQFGFGV